jgi:hypothetical protein
MTFQMEYTGFVRGLLGMVVGHLPWRYLSYGNRTENPYQSPAVKDYRRITLYE